MHLYLIRYFGGEMRFVFARTRDRASQVFLTWTLANGGAEEVWSVGRIHTDGIDPVPLKHINDALGLGIEGVGHFHFEDGWTIEPIEGETLATVQLLDRHKSA